MRSVRTISLLAGVLALALGSTALACSGDQTKVSGTFDASGRFVLNGAWDAKGAAIANTKGMVLESFTTAENLVLPASSLAGKAVCLFGDLDAATKTMTVSGFKECGASCDPAACGAKGAAAAAACGTKSAAMQAAGGAACGTKSAAMQAAGGAACGTKSAAMQAAGGAACASKGAAAQTASAKTASADGCCPSGAAAKTASAGASCASGAAAKTASAGSSCATKGAGAAAASAKTADSKADCATKSTLVYSVSGMTCGGCASQVKSAVAKMANVGDCSVDLEKAQAVVTTTGTVDAAEIGKAITAAGFPAELAPAEAPAETAKS